MAKLNLTKVVVDHPNGVNIKNHTTDKCPSCGERTYGESTLGVGDIFLWNSQLKMVAGQYNVKGFRIIEFNRSVNMPAGISMPTYANLYTLSKDFNFPTPIGNIKDILPKQLREFL